MEKKLSLVEQTQKMILDYIASHPYDKQLPKEEEFIEILNVSRGILREALSRLRALGIIETKKKRGSVLVNPDIFAILRPVINSNLLDKEALKNLYQFRLMMEIGAADFIFMGRTENNMKELDAIVEEEAMLEEELSKAESEEEKYALAYKRSDIDIRFHGKLYEMTGNKYMTDFLFIVRHLFTLYAPTIKKDFRERTVVSHVGLYNLLRTGTPDAFRLAMRLHLNPLFTRMDEIINDSANS